LAVLGLPSLKSEYQLVDTSLILALVSDYAPSDLEANLQIIRDQLGIIEATLVADSIDETEALIHVNRAYPNDASTQDTASLLEVLSLEGGAEAEGEAGLNLSGLGHSKTSRSSGSGSGSKRSRSNKSGSTSPTSGGEEVGPGAERDLLKSLFPDTYVAPDRRTETKALTFTRPDEDVRNALASSVDVQAAIDFLLSVETIRDVEHLGYWPGDEGHLSDDDRNWEFSRNKSRDKLSLSSPELPASPTFKSAPMSRTPSAASGSRSASKGKGKKKAEHLTIPLVDTLQRRPSPRSSRPTSRTASPSRAPPSGPSPNAWHTIASLALYLSELLSLPQAFFLTYLHSPDYHSAYSAVCAALASGPERPGGRDEIAEAMLQEVYGVSLLSDGDDHDHRADSGRAQIDLELCVKAAGEDVATVMDLMDLLSEISLWPSDDDDLDRLDGPTAAAAATQMARSASMPARQTAPSKQATVVVAPNPNRLLTKPKVDRPVQAERIVPGSRAPPSSTSNPTAYDDFGSTPSYPSSPAPGAQPRMPSNRQVHPLNWRKVSHPRTARDARILHPYASHIPAYARGALPSDSTPGSLFSTTVSGGMSVEDCLRRASAERQRREGALREAGAHFGRSTLAGGKAISGSVAGHYAKEAREAMDRARNWELQAARMVVDAQLERTGHTIDLHHLTIDEAVTVASESVSRWYETQSEVSRSATPGELRGKGATWEPARGMTIITGVGRHSAGKRGVLGPAVASALEREGWRVDRGDSGRGYLVVRGKR
jgi:hypothetical protein